MSSLSFDRLAASIDRLYEAALIPDLWPDTLSGLAAACGGLAASLVFNPPERRGWIIGSPEMAPAYSKYARGDWAARNFRLTLTTPELMASHQVITEAALLSPRELQRQPIQNEFFTPYGMRDFIGFSVLPGEILCAIERGANPAADWERAALRKALPHMTRIGQLAQARGQAHMDGTLDTLSQFDHAALLLDRNGLVIHLNAAAETLYPTAFQIMNGQLRPRHASSLAAVQALLNAATGPMAAHESACLGEIAVPRPSGGSLILRAAPLAGAAQDMFRRAKAIVLLLAPDHGVPIKVQQLRRLFGLTVAEARIARRLAQGEDVESVAAALSVSRATVRTHLSKIFAKTDTNRQAELAALLSRIFARLGG